MNIEIAKPGRMTQTGSSLLRLIQNNDMPLLDLLVRESIQNSLDAHNEDTAFVNVQYLTGQFESALFVRHLERIDVAMTRHYPNTRYTYLAIRDSNTVGLTGPLHYDDVTTNDYGNLLKLVYEISKPQEIEGAGGSWGLGKTVYFRVGIGMVLYYSRIKNDDRSFSSRLAVSMVENENAKDAIIPRLGSKAKRGIAWWGDPIGDNKTQPIRDTKQIAEILSIFGLQTYSGHDTGTTIVIPYIDSKKLLVNNVREYQDGSGNVIPPPYWSRNVDEYLDIAVQRWYAPRLENINYKYGPHLKVRINGSVCTCKASPFFQLVQKLYEVAITTPHDANIEWNGYSIIQKSIKPRSLLETSDAGRLVFVKVTKDQMLEGPPNNKNNPYVYADCERQNYNANPPIVMFCRKPGMLVSYETSGTWVDGITPTKYEEYIIGIFVLNSEVSFRSEIANRLPLEEYVRRCEKADHASWSDITLAGCNESNPRLIFKIKNQISNAISKAYEIPPLDGGIRKNMGLGKFFGDLLLPPVNFGTQPGNPIGGNGGGGEIVSRAQEATLRIDRKKINYRTDGKVEFPFRVDLQKKAARHGCEITAEVAVDTNTISATEWELWTNMMIPFKIASVHITEYGQDGHSRSQFAEYDGLVDHITVGTINIGKLETGQNSWYGIKVVGEEETSYTLKGWLVISSTDKTVKTSFKLGLRM